MYTKAAALLPALSRAREAGTLRRMGYPPVAMFVALTVLSGQILPTAAEELTAYVSPNVRYSSPYLWILEPWLTRDCSDWRCWRREHLPWCDMAIRNSKAWPGSIRVRLILKEHSRPASMIGLLITTCGPQWLLGAQMCHLLTSVLNSGSDSYSGYVSDLVFMEPSGVISHSQLEDDYWPPAHCTSSVQYRLGAGDFFFSD